MSRGWPSLGVALLAVFAVSLLARGQLAGPRGIHIPYRGHLEQDGVPFTGELSLQFHVYNEAAGGSPCFSTGWLATSVLEGAFATEIGPVPDGCVIGRPLYLEVSLDAGGGPRPLTGRQRVVPVVGAVSSGAGDFYVEGRLDMRGALSVAGTLSVGGQLEVSSAETTSATVADLTVMTPPVLAGGLEGRAAPRGPAVRMRDAFLEGSHLSGGNVAGNLHLDANIPARAPNTGGKIFLNWYSGAGIVFGNGQQQEVARVDANGAVRLVGNLSAPNNVHGACYATGYGCGQIVCADGYYAASVEFAENQDCRFEYYGEHSWDLGSYSLWCCRL